MATLSDRWRSGRVRRATAAALFALATVGVWLDALAGGTVVDTPFSTVGVVLAGFLVGAWWSPRLAAVATGVGAAALTAANQRADPGAYAASDDLVFFVVLLGGSVLAGALVSARRRQVRRLRRLSEALAVQEADEVRAAAAEERQALLVGLAASLLEPVDALGDLALRAGAEPEAYARIEQTARSTLVELRAVLGVLDAPVAPEPPTPLPPPPPPRRPGWVDLLLAASGVPVAIEALAGTGARSPLVVAGVVALGLLLGAPLLLRRTHPLVAVTGVLGFGLLLDALTPLTHSVAVLLPLSLASYALGAHPRGRRRLAAGVAALGATALVEVVGHAGAVDVGVLVPTLGWVLVSMVFGALAAAEADRAARLRGLVARLEQGRDHALRRARAEGREELARDLHDSLAHAMTVVCLHAEAAQLPGADADRRRSSMAAVAGAARSATRELRDGLSVLDGVTGLRDDLIGVAAGLGLAVAVTVAPDVGGTQAELVRRVVREALVNATRHAPGAAVDVRVASTDGHVLIEVRSGAPAGPGATAPTAGAGRGLAGLARVVAEAGGHLEHGALGGGAFRVLAELPGERTVDPVRVPT